ncbi:MAG TPA: threonine--tRNA ligase [archaeon]|nr:threonine--tRNA ligase [archaeon]
MSENIKITFPDGSVQEWPSGSTAMQIAQKIGARLSKDALAAKVNGKLVDLSASIESDSKFEILTFDSEEGKHIFWHSSAHIMAAAIKNLFPEVKLGIGPPIEMGFYYDFGGKVFSDSELGKIEDEMKKIIKSAEPFERKEISKAEAEKLFVGEPFKTELVNELEGKIISTYKTGKFTDLCEGPHVPSSDKIGAVKLLKTSAAYWKGDQKNQQLQRIYGVSFRSQKELEAFVKMREEAEARSHHVLGPKLGLFMFHETAPGIPYWLPNGVILINELVNFWRAEHAKRGYKEIVSPLINKKELWEISGHWEHYRENMFISEMGENEVYGLKAMNCPNAMIVFGSQTRSYRDLPLRFSDTDILHRYEISGTLNGLFRVRAFRQDDSHNFITEDMIEEEYERIFDIAELFYGIFGLKYKFRLGTRPENFMGDLESWNRAETALKKILDKKAGKGNYLVAEKDGAFYGPKIDILMTDALGREWQTGTIQLDFQQPKRFGLKYTDKDNKEKTPLVVHRVIYGSLERFMGILIEHYAGAFPLWLAPVQVRIITVSDKQIDFAKNISEKLLEAGLRAETDLSNATVEYKVRNVQLEKIPYTVTIGDKEVEKKTLAVRGRDGKVKFGVSVEDFVAQLKSEMAAKK